MVDVRARASHKCERVSKSALELEPALLEGMLVTAAEAGCSTRNQQADPATLTVARHTVPSHRGAPAAQQSSSSQVTGGSSRRSSSRPARDSKSSAALGARVKQESRRAGEETPLLGIVVRTLKPEEEGAALHRVTLR